MVGVTFGKGVLGAGWYLTPYCDRMNTTLHYSIAPAILLNDSQ